MTRTRSSSRGKIVLRASSREAALRLLVKGQEWFRKTGRDLVDELHQARRRDRQREQSRRP